MRGDLDDEEATKNSESPRDKKEEAKEKLVAPISKKNTKYLKNLSRHRR